MIKLWPATRDKQVEAGLAIGLIGFLATFVAAIGGVLSPLVTLVGAAWAMAWIAFA